MGVGPSRVDVRVGGGVEVDGGLSQSQPKNMRLLFGTAMCYVSFSVVMAVPLAFRTTEVGAIVCGILFTVFYCLALFLIWLRANYKAVHACRWVLLCVAGLYLSNRIALAVRVRDEADETSESVLLALRYVSHGLLHTVPLLFLRCTVG